MLVNSSGDHLPPLPYSSACCVYVSHPAPIVCLTLDSQALFISNGRRVSVLTLILTFHATPVISAPGLNSYLYIEASPKTEQQRARILSPTVGADTGPLCLLFSYQLWGEAQGNLRVLLRDAHQEETLLWTLRGDQGPVWKEGRTILPRSPKEFPVPHHPSTPPHPPPRPHTPPPPRQPPRGRARTRPG